MTIGFEAARSQPLTKTDIAYTAIRKAILEGALVPGQQLDQESLSLSLGLSTTPVREAIRRLEAQRLVVSRAHRDTIVAPLSRADLEEAYSVRLALDPLAGQLAAAQITAVEVFEARSVAEDMTPRDAVEHLHLNRKFHRLIYCASRNTVLINALESLWDMTDRYRLITLRQGIAQVANEEHLAILDAVARGDGDGAYLLLRKHTADSLDRIRSTVDDTTDAVNSI